MRDTFFMSVAAWNLKEESPTNLICWAIEKNYAFVDSFFIVLLLARFTCHERASSNR